MSLCMRGQTAEMRREKLKVKRQTVRIPFGTEAAFSRITYCLLLIACFLFVLAGCEENFQPIRNNSDSGAFSMFGYLDATADTQWCG